MPNEITISAQMHLSFCFYVVYVLNAYCGNFVTILCTYLPPFLCLAGSIISDVADDGLTEGWQLKFKVDDRCVASLFCIMRHVCYY